MREFMIHVAQSGPHCNVDTAPTELIERVVNQLERIHAPGKWGWDEAAPLTLFRRINPYPFSSSELVGQVRISLGRAQDIDLLLVELKLGEPMIHLTGPDVLVWSPPMILRDRAELQAAMDWLDKTRVWLD